MGSSQRHFVCQPHPSSHWAASDQSFLGNVGRAVQAAGGTHVGLQLPRRLSKGIFNEYSFDHFSELRHRRVSK